MSMFSTIFQIKADEILVIILAIMILFFLYCLFNSPTRLSQISAFRSQSQGLSSDAIKKLPIILHQTDCSNPALEEAECCICLSEFKDGEKVKVLPSCDHCFHSKCVDKWLVNHSSCPLCRASLKMDYEFPEILIQEPPVRYS